MLRSGLVPEPYRSMLIGVSGKGDVAKIDEIRRMAAEAHPRLFVSEHEEAEIARKLGMPYKQRKSN